MKGIPGAGIARPSCANGYVLTEMLRKRWNRPDALITTDCGAVRNLRGFPAHATSDAQAAAWAVNNGTDLEMGSTLFESSKDGGLVTAVANGWTTEEIVTAAARRSLVPLFKAGRFDRMSTVGWAGLGAEDIGTASAFNTQVMKEAALQSFVLLKNGPTESGPAGVGNLPSSTNKPLPLRRGVHVAVVGPQAIGTGLFSDYFGDEVCYNPYGHYQSDTSCVPTIAASIAAVNVGGTTRSAAGVGITSMSWNETAVEEALALVRTVDGLH
jgi:beta-glucosidase-like glycosyl hydrolase